MKHVLVKLDDGREVFTYNSIWRWANEIKLEFSGHFNPTEILNYTKQALDAWICLQDKYPRHYEGRNDAQGASRHTSNHIKDDFDYNFQEDL